MCFRRRSVARTEKPGLRKLPSPGDRARVDQICVFCWHCNWLTPTKYAMPIDTDDLERLKMALVVAKESTVNSILPCAGYEKAEAYRLEIEALKQEFDDMRPRSNAQVKKMREELNASRAKVAELEEKNRSSEELLKEVTAAHQQGADVDCDIPNESGWCANCGKQIQSVKSTSQDDRQRVQNWLATTAQNANKATTTSPSAPTTSQVPKPEVKKTAVVAPTMSTTQAAPCTTCANTKALEVELKLLTDENDELNTQIEGLRKGQGTMTKQRNAEKAEFEEKVKNLTEEKKKLELRLTEQAKHLENSLKYNQQKDVEIKNLREELQREELKSNELREAKTKIAAASLQQIKGLEGKNLRLTSEILELRESAVTYTRIRVKITNIPMDDTQEDVIKKWLDGGKHLIYWDESPDMFMRLLADDTQSCVAYLANEKAAREKPAPASSTQRPYVPREQQATTSQATSKNSTSTPTPPKSSTPDPKATNVLSIRGFGNEATDKEIIQLVDGSTQLFQKKDGKPRIEKYPGYHLVYMNTPIIAEKVFNRLQGRTYKWGKLQVSYHL
ncbi:unnamed protein product, partial [Mesorhabditis spiculigera]